MRDRVVIGGASGYWGEAGHATGQLLATRALDFLVYDYLAEITLSIMARARAKDPAAGFAGDFLTGALAPNLAEIARQKVRVISNAGGVNPRACAEAIRAMLAKQDIRLKVAVVSGDDLTDRANEFAGSNVTEMISAMPFPVPQSIASINAYLGAFPIAAALDAGADIVITGRCVDSAVTLGACIHAFGWGAEAFDLLAAGSLAGHLLECGPQATGGNFTDWRLAGDLADIGYPIGEIKSDGSITITKPEGTTGIVSPASVGEQMLYEIGDPRAYMLPDVTCDFTAVTLRQSGDNRVTVEGARGYPPSSTYKVSATFADGFRAGQLVSFNGFEAREKAHAFADAVIRRSRDRLRGMNAPDFDEVSTEVGGGGDEDWQEVILKIAVRHGDARAVGLFLKELAGLGLATPPGMSVFTAGGRPRPSPVVRLFSFLVDKDHVPVQVELDGEVISCGPTAVTTGDAEPVETELPEMPQADGKVVTIPLIRLACARSGDKGNDANIGVIARKPEYMPWIWASLTEAAVAKRFSDFLAGPVERFYLPGANAMNLVLHNALGGGGIASLRNDAQGKGFAQILLAHPVAVPENLIDDTAAGG